MSTSCSTLRLKKDMYINSTHSEYIMYKSNTGEGENPLKNRKYKKLKKKN